MLTPQASEEAGSPPNAETSGLGEGEMVTDRYRIVSKLGEGGMGAVYLAEHVLMHKRVALKVLHAELAKSEEVVSRFEREAVAASSIDHPNIAGATDFGRLPDGSFFLVLEYVKGRSLRDEIEKGALGPERALRIFRGMSAAVSAAHAKNIVHRDLKPENVMLVERDGDPDFVKVLDFGIAKMISQDAEPAQKPTEGKALTQVGTIVGTPLYMSPEQGLGQPVDVRSDLYSLGVIWFEMLSGTPPFVGDMVAIIRQHLTEPPPPLPQATLYEPLIRLLLEKDPPDRVQTAMELLRFLDAPPGASVVPAIPADARGSVEPAPQTVSPKLARRILFAMVPLTILVAAVCLFLVFRDTSRRHRMPVQRETSNERLIKEDGKKVAVAAPPVASTTQKASSQQKQEGGKKTWGGVYVPPPSQWFK